MSIARAKAAIRAIEKRHRAMADRSFREHQNRVKVHNERAKADAKRQIAAMGLEAEIVNIAMIKKSQGRWTSFAVRNLRRKR